MTTLQLNDIECKDECKAYKQTKYIDMCINEMQTGDLILFEGTHSLISSAVKWWTNSKYSHIGMVLVNPKIGVYDINQNMKELKGVYLVESGCENIPDIIDNTYKYGVQVVPLCEVIKNYEGHIYWRKLNISNSHYTTDTIMTTFTNIYSFIKNKKYDLDIIDLFCSRLNITQPTTIYKYAILNWFSHDTQKNDKFVCSALVAYIYTHFEFLPNITEWTECIPKYFSDENTDLYLKNNVFLEREKKLK
jgi:hypothetical protein